MTKTTQVNYEATVNVGKIDVKILKLMLKNLNKKYDKVVADINIIEEELYKRGE